MKPIFLALALTACVPTTGTVIIPAPIEFAGRTAADEQIAIGIEQGYKAFRMALELGVDTGVIKGDRARLAARADAQAYSGVLIAREAYLTANAEDFINAARSANSTIGQAIALVKGSK